MQEEKRKKAKRFKLTISTSFPTEQEREEFNEWIREKPNQSRELYQILMAAMKKDKGG